MGLDILYSRSAWRRLVAALGALVLALPFVLGAFGSARAAAPEPTISVGTCIEHGGSDPQPEGSPIKTCCMDSDVTGIRGCYICDTNWKNCVWDAAYNAAVSHGALGGNNKAPVSKAPPRSPVTSKPASAAP